MHLMHSEGSIYVRIIHEGKVSSATTLLKVYPEEWNMKEHCIVFSENIQRRYILYTIEKELSEIRCFFEKKIEHYKDRCIQFKSSNIMAVYREKREQLSVFVEGLCEELEKGEQYETSSAYRKVLNDFLKFVNEDNLLVKQFTSSLIDRYEEDMCNRNKRANVIASYIHILRVIHDKIITKKLYDSASLKSFNRTCIGVGAVTKKAMTQKEIRLKQQKKNIIYESVDFNFSEFANRHMQSSILKNRKSPVVLVPANFDAIPEKQLAVNRSLLEKALHLKQ